jgi:hypothetical protein
MYASEIGTNRKLSQQHLVGNQHPGPNIWWRHRCHLVVLLSDTGEVR